MPIWLRKFTYSKLSEFYQESTTDRQTDDKIQEGIKEALRERQNQITSYSTKASKK